MPASWSKGGYTKLFTREAPNVLFDDMFVVHVTEKETRFKIDPKFISVCEKGTLESTSTEPNQAVATGSEIDGGELIVRMSRKFKKPVRVVVSISAIRRGFLKVRFPDATRAEFLANERWIKRGGN